LPMPVEKNGGNNHNNNQQDNISIHMHLFNNTATYNHNSDNIYNNTPVTTTPTRANHDISNPTQRAIDNIMSPPPTIF
jgi:hypothetical protein